MVVKGALQQSNRKKNFNLSKTFRRSKKVNFQSRILTIPSNIVCKELGRTNVLRTMHSFRMWIIIMLTKYGHCSRFPCATTNPWMIMEWPIWTRIITTSSWRLALIDKIQGQMISLTSLSYWTQFLSIIPLVENAIYLIIATKAAV